jgi:hypothetical protein
VGSERDFVSRPPLERLDGPDSYRGPVRFLTSILGRPKNGRPFVLIPIGFPAADAAAPDIGKKEHRRSEGGPMAPFPKKQACDVTATD